MRYVIIGGGIAGVTAAEELRKLDASCQITIISEEHYPLYSRVLLPHYLKGKIPRERVFLKKEQWYSQQNIEWMTGVRVVGLDAQSKFVGLSNGRELPYDRVLIATAGELRTLGSDLRGVSYLRTLDDADHLNQLLSERKNSDRAAIYGGGFIACEYLNIFAYANLPTCIAFRGPYFWSTILEPDAGQLINNHLITKGVELQSNAAFSDMIGEKELEGFLTSAGKQACSILGVGIGIEPDTSWLQQAGIELGSGVRCDEYLQTNKPDVFVAGDVACFFDVNVGRHVTVGNWMNAQMQGRVVAKNMFGTKTVFSLVSSYATNALGFEIIFVGDVSKQDADEIRLIHSASTSGITQLFSRKNRLIGAVLLNRNTDRPIVTKMIQEKSSAADLLAST